MDSSARPWCEPCPHISRKMLKEVLPVRQPGREFFHWHGLGDVIALGVGTAYALQEVPILLGFHAHRHRAAVQAARQSQAGAQHRADGLFFRSAIDKAAVYL